ncbi:MAG: hypothetical protein ACXACK_06695 [Candidatus Hodarchaeales archaeon]|jgi:hypothetical protein
MKPEIMLLPTSIGLGDLTSIESLRNKKSRKKLKTYWKVPYSFLYDCRVEKSLIIGTR